MIRRFLRSRVPQAPGDLIDCFEDRLAQPLHWRKPSRVFVNSMSDLFHEDLTDEQIAALARVRENRAITGGAEGIYAARPSIVPSLVGPAAIIGSGTSLAIDAGAGANTFEMMKVINDAKDSYRLSIEGFAARVAPHPHVLHRRGMAGIRPAPQALDQTP